MKAVYKTEFPNLPLKNRGKVRDIYDLDTHYLIVATDRISAFDVIMNEPIIGKGIILNQISKFWFENTKHIIQNHVVSTEVEDYPESCQRYKSELECRSMLVKKCKPLPIECIVRGYIAGSGWKDYLTSGSISSIPLPDGLIEFQQLPTPIFTPSTKAEEGHDQNIGIEETAELLGELLSGKIASISIELYQFAHSFMKERGIILADTKFEFGIDSTGELILIDEVLTPDSSRFWLSEDYSAGKPQTNFDKQILRDYLESLSWNKQYPPPILPNEIIDKTLEKYQAALFRITGNIF